MSRLYTRNNHGRQPLLSTPKIARSKGLLDDTYQEPGRRNKPTRTYAATVQQAKRRRAASTASTSSSGDTDGEDGSDEGSDGDVDDDEEQDAVAPSRRSLVREAGPTFAEIPFDTAPLAGTVESMFGDYEDYYDHDEDPGLSPYENLKRLEDRVFANSDDDEDFYRGVDDISDSDDDVDQYEEQQLIDSLTEDDIPDEEFNLNQIEGLSAYGFGDESDATVPFPPSSRASDAGVVNESGIERHVRFEMDSAQAFHLPMSSSPTISRALLPSALPEHGKVYGGPASLAAEAYDDLTSDESYDSDATDDCLPEEALQSLPNVGEVAEVYTNLPPSPSTTPRPPTKRSQRKGPPRGVFIDEGDKASGILDPTGKIILITHPHLLGEEFAKRYGNSASNSPSIGFEELIEESEAGDLQDKGNVTATAGTDIMLASLNSHPNDPTDSGQATGPREAFYPTLGFDIGDYSFEDFGGDLHGDPDLGEDVINMEDVIKFDDDSDDSDEPTSPIFMPPNKGLSMPGSDFSHLTNDNITAFRRNADPGFTTLNNTPSFNQLSEFSTPARSRKRKANDSPYTSSHYNGVTPVQRMRDPNPSSTPDSTIRPKRRRLMTA